jgi:hypothetical protein
MPVPWLSGQKTVLARSQTGRNACPYHCLARKVSWSIIGGNCHTGSLKASLSLFTWRDYMAHSPPRFSARNQKPHQARHSWLIIAYWIKARPGPSGSTTAVVRSLWPAKFCEPVAARRSAPTFRNPQFSDYGFLLQYLRANGAFRSHLNDVVLPPEADLVPADDGSLRGVIGGCPAAEFAFPGDGPKLLIQHRGAAAGAEEHRSRIGDLVIKNLLDGRRPATRSHYTVEVGRRKEFRRGHRGFRHNR